MPDGVLLRRVSAKAAFGLICNWPAFPGLSCVAAMRLPVLGFGR